jgi:chloramphenicol-sensitive protein RarD
VAFGILAWFEFEGSGAFGSRGPGFAALLAFAGVATGLPLLLYAAGAKRIKLATMGLLQYIAPSGNLLIAVWIFDEPFTGVEALTFGFIWLALIIYTVEIWRTRIV